MLVSENPKGESVDRLGFSPFVIGLDEILGGGVPRGSWVSIFGPPGGYKTLHSLAFCLSGIENGERCVYVSTEMDAAQLKRQVQSLGWKTRNQIYERHFTNKIIEDRDYGNYEMVVVDTDSLYFWALKLNAIVRKEKEGGREKKYYWFTDYKVLAHVIITALGAVGVLERSAKEITLDEIEYARLKDGLYRSDHTLFKVTRDIKARVVIDSLSPYIEGKYSQAGNIATSLKMRLSIPSVTYIIVNHASKTTEDELGAAIGHVVDGRIKLWMDLQSGEAVHYGWVVKMRETKHSRKIHKIEIQEKEAKTIKWEQ